MISGNSKIMWILGLNARLKHGNKNSSLMVRATDWDLED